MKCKYTNLLINEIDSLNNQYQQMSATDPRAINLLFQITEKQTSLILLLLRKANEHKQ